MPGLRSNSVSTAHINATGVNLTRGGQRVLTDVDLTVSAGERLGIVGENGRGKTSLLQVLTGTLSADPGSVHRAGSLGVAEQEMTVTDGRTVGDLIDVELRGVRAVLSEFERATEALSEQHPGAEQEFADALAAAEAIDAWEADRRVDVSLAALSAVTDRERPLATLSVGQRYRIRLAGLLGAGHDVLLLDEPTNHLDAAGLDHLTTKLREHRGAVVLVSHDRALLADVATSVLDLDPTRDGTPRVYGGGYAGYRDGHRAERERWETDYRDQVGERQRLAQDLSSAQNRLSTGWKPVKGTGKHTRATRAPALVRMVHRRQVALEAHVVDVPKPPLRLRFPSLPAIPGSTLLHAEEVTVSGRLETPRTVRIFSGDRLVVTGANGSGKSSLLSVLAGKLTPSSGRVSVNRSARIALLAQESPRQGEQRAVDRYDAFLGELVSAGTLAEQELPSLSQLGLLGSSSTGQPVSGLSLGQQRRLDLAMTLAMRPHVVLLDEPTNHLSMGLVDELTQALTETGAAVVLATHDRQLLRDTASWPRLSL
ncbi:ABC-F family ATP-binding cassette domain-containing protein [Saccharomonospora sp. NPDC006951]